MKLKTMENPRFQAKNRLSIPQFISQIEKVFHKSAINCGKLLRQFDGTAFHDDLPISAPFAIILSDSTEGAHGMGSNYAKGVIDQLWEATKELEFLRPSYKRACKEIDFWKSGYASVEKENISLRQAVSSRDERIEALEATVAKLTKELQLAQEDRERMARILSNNSSNSSIPPSAEPPWKGKPANTYNGRKPTKKKAGAQTGHKGSGLSKAEVEEKIQKRVYKKRVKDIGEVSRPYISRYIVDVDIHVVATEVRIHADENGKYQVPDDLKGEVTYGKNIRSIVAYLFSEGVVSINKISDFINAIAGDTLHMSNGTTYNICRNFAEKCVEVVPALTENLLNSHTICTDATPVTNNGKMSYIRNFSTDNVVLYIPSNRKNLNTLSKMEILEEFAGTFCHDHEMALYHFGTGHAECNVHLNRYLLKNTEETQNTWSKHMRSFLNGMNDMRKELQKEGVSCLSAEKAAAYSARYDAIIAEGREQNKKTKGREARREEKNLLNRLEKFKDNYLLFLYDFQVPFSNNMSEKDLRICKNREKMAGGFRSDSGMQIYCAILSFIETMKRKKRNVFRSIAKLMNGEPVVV